MPLTRRDFGAVDTALNKLLELTMWQVVNQRAAMVGALIIPPPLLFGSHSAFPAHSRLAFTCSYAGAGCTIHFDAAVAHQAGVREPKRR